MPRACFVLSLFLAPAALAAQQAPNLTEEEFLAALAGDHPALVALTREREIAAAEAIRAALLPNPEIGVSLEEPGEGLRETTAGLKWTPPLDGRRALRRAAADEGRAAAENRFAAARFRLRLELRRLYADWAFAWERRELSAAHLEGVRELAERARARAQAGEIPGLAGRRFTLEEAQARADLGRAEAKLATARSILPIWVPEIPAQARPVSPALLPLAAGSFSPPVRPDLVAAEHEVKRTAALRRLSARVFEAPALGVGWKRIEDRTTEASGPVLSAAWTVPLFDRRQADRREAEALLAAARADLEVARKRAEADRAAALLAYERLRTAAIEAERASAPAGELVAGAAAAYQLGESGLTDLLDTLRAALAARVTALEIREAALAAQRELEAAIGRPLSGDLP